MANLAKSYQTCLEISRRKNTDYAGDANPFKNFENSLTVGVPVPRGILVRVMDKISRINNLLDNEAQVKDEKLEDTILDAINYLAILKAYLEANSNIS